MIKRRRFIELAVFPSLLARTGVHDAYATETGKAVFQRARVDSSGAAVAIANLAQLLYGWRLSENEVLLGSPNTLHRSVSDLLYMGSRSKVSLRAYAVGEASIKRLKLPVIILIAPSRTQKSKFVVLTSTSNGIAKYIDPLNGETIVQLADFYQMWVVRRDAERPAIAIGVPGQSFQAL
jgi:ABC-type bacteriocin/lantibiotic exporter with double-glycine peptidase domain